MKKNDIDLPRELVLPTKLVLSKEIDNDYKFLYAYISYRCGVRGYMWFSNDTLATHMGKSTRAIERGLKALREAKWIHIENRVKAGDMYHQDMRRVIWVYSEYLLALDKGGYGVAKPLAFRTWKTRFINAMLDNSKVPFVLYFFPTLEEMGKNRVYHEVNENRLYTFVGSGATLSTKPLSKEEENELYVKLYKFYCDQHNSPAPTPEEKPTFKHIADFREFMDYIHDNYYMKI